MTADINSYSMFNDNSIDDAYSEVYAIFSPDFSKFHVNFPSNEHKVWAVCFAEGDNPYLEAWSLLVPSSSPTPH